MTYLFFDLLRVSGFLIWVFFGMRSFSSDIQNHTEWDDGKSNLYLNFPRYISGKPRYNWKARIFSHLLQRNKIAYPMSKHKFCLFNLWLSRFLFLDLQVTNKRQNKKAIRYSNQCWVFFLKLLRWVGWDGSNSWKIMLDFEGNFSWLELY